MIVACWTCREVDEAEDVACWTRSEKDEADDCWVLDS